MPNFKENSAKKALQTYDSPTQGVNAPFAQVLLEVIEDDRISAGAFRLYTLLIAYSRGLGNCWLSQITLASKLGASERTVRVWVGELVKAGLVAIEHRRTHFGQHQTNLYRILKSVAVGDKSTTLRQATSIASGNLAPQPPENSCQSHRKSASADSYEPKTYKKRDYKHT